MSIYIKSIIFSFLIIMDDHCISTNKTVNSLEDFYEKTSTILI